MLVDFVLLSIVRTYTQMYIALAQIQILSHGMNRFKCLQFELNKRNLDWKYYMIYIHVRDGDCEKDNDCSLTHIFKI